MKITKHSRREAIDKFKSEFQDEFGRTISDSEIQEIAIGLLRFFGVRYPRHAAGNLAAPDRTDARRK